MLSGGGLVQVPANRISPVPSHVYPGRPGSRDERPSSRESWQSPRHSSRPSSRDSNVSGGRPSSRGSPRIDAIRTISPPRECVPSRQLHQLLTQTHPVQILTAQGIQVVRPGQPAGQVQGSSGAGILLGKADGRQGLPSQKHLPGSDQRRYLSPEQLRRESAPNILRREPSPQNYQRRDSAPNPYLQPHPKIKVEEASPPSQRQPTNNSGKSSIPNPFFRGLKLPVHVPQQPLQETLPVSRSRATPTSAEVTASQVLPDFFSTNFNNIFGFPFILFVCMYKGQLGD